MSKITNYINQISNFRNLNLADSEELFQIIVNNGASQAQISAIITALKIKSESYLELLAYIKILLEKSKFKIRPDINLCSTDIYNRRNLESVILTSSLIASQDNIKITKYLHKSLSNVSNVFKFINGLGINYRKLSPDISLSNFYEHNIGLFTTDSLKNLYNITENMEEIDVKSLLYIMPNIALPNLARNLILLVRDHDQAELFAKLFTHLPEIKVWIIYNEFSYIGLLSDQPNYILEIENNIRKNITLDLKSYNFQPLGQIDSIYTSHHAREIFFGKNNIFYNLVMVYTALHFMIQENLSLNSAINKSENIIKSSKALDLISKLISSVNFAEPEKI